MTLRTSNEVQFTVLEGSDIVNTGIKVELFNSSLELIGPLYDSFDRSWSDPLDEPGGAELKLPDEHRHANVDDLHYGHLLRWSLDGTRRFVSVLRTRTRNVIEEKGEVWSVKGPGGPGWYSRAMVGPEGELETDNRVFTFASRYYDRSDWDPAVELTGADLPEVEGWPAQYDSVPSVWTQAVDAENDHPAGVSFFLCDFDITPGVIGSAGKSQVEVLFTADDEVDGWLDTWRFASMRGPHSASKASKIAVSLKEGEHRLAWAVRNLPRPPSGQNPGVMRFVVRARGSTNDEWTTIATSDPSDTDGLGYPDEVPGMTVGHVFRVLNEEAITRGVNLPFPLGFTDEEDSNNVPWARAADFSFSVGDSLLEVLENFLEGDLDGYGVNPDNWNLELYQDAAIDKSVGEDPVVFRVGHNLVDYAVGGTAATASAVFAKTDDGLVPHSAINMEERIEGGIVSFPNDLSDKARQRSLEALFDEVGVPRDAVSGSVTSVERARAYKDWWPGVYVLAPDGWTDHELKKRRLRSLSVTDGSDDETQVSVELSTLEQERDLRIDKWLSRLSPGALKGWSARARPRKEAPLTQGSGDSPSTGGTGGGGDGADHPSITAHTDLGLASQVYVDDEIDTHDHDADYSSSVHDHDEDYSSTAHNHDADYSSTAHDHDADYSSTTHHHDADYAPDEHDHPHDHDADYSATTHDHDTDYSATTHNHDADYSDTEHTHAEYSETVHDHDADYSSTTHDHTGVYAPDAHDHDADYSSTAHHHDADYSATTHHHDADYAPDIHDHPHQHAYIGLDNTTSGDIDEWVDWGSPITGLVSPFSGNVEVHAQVTGRLTYDEATVSRRLGEVRVGISLDGGATWDYGKQLTVEVRGGDARRVSTANQHFRSGVKANGDDVQVKVQCVQKTLGNDHDLVFGDGSLYVALYTQ